MSTLGGCDEDTDDETASDDTDDALEKNASDDDALCVTRGRSMMSVGSANVGLLAEHALSVATIRMMRISAFMCVFDCMEECGGMRVCVCIRVSVYSHDDV
jgi:hypothetical protein